MTDKILAVLLHIGNKSLVNYLFEKIKNIDVPYDLYISYKGERDDIETIINEKNFRLIPYFCDHDISGFLSMINYIFSIGKKYYYLIFLHTKSDEIWRENLVNSILGSKDIFRENLLNFICSKDIGMIGSRIYRKTLDELNEPYLTKLCSKLKIRVNSEYEFIGGTIFMVRFLIVKELYKRIIKAFGSFSNFYSKIERTKLDNNIFPTYTHSMERIFAFMTKSLNYKIHFKK